MSNNSVAKNKRRVFITGSADGLGHAAAKALISQGHEVVVHVRSKERLSAVDDLVACGAIATIGDLANFSETQDLAQQVNNLGRMDAVIHNAGVYKGDVAGVNVLAPYLLTALMHRPQRLIYLSSGMHTSGRAKFEDLDWNTKASSVSYSDSKLLITAFSAAIARRWSHVFCNAVDPGWVPTKMGGPSASDDLREGHLTQEWLAVSDEPEALTSGDYWYHKKRTEPHAKVLDTDFQNRLLEKLAKSTGVELGV